MVITVNRPVPMEEDAKVMKERHSDLMWLPLPFCGFQEWGRALYTMEMALWWFIKGSEP